MSVNIAKEDWSKFFDDISRQNLNWETRVEVMNEAIGNQVAAKGLPLIGIVAVTKDSGEATIEISLGNDDNDNDHITHIIEDPQDIVAEFIADKASSVAIKDKHGTVTMIRLQEVLPKMIAAQ